jgi:hypothetical protein
MIVRIALLLPLLAALSAGCKREEIRVYIAPKDRAFAREESPSEPGRSRPQLTWVLPRGWQETDPGKVSVANFAIKTSEGEASVNITPLPNLEGQEAMVVNMWREQVGQRPLTEEEIVASLVPVEVAGEPGKLFEIAGADKRRIITAMQHRGDASWFFKLAGDEAVVIAQKPAFLDFIKSVRMKESLAPTTTAHSHAHFNWSVPDQWHPLEAKEMQIARFAVPERGGAKAEVSVSIFPNDTGGTLANVNRWRKQIGLGEIGEADLPSVVRSLDGSEGGAILVELANASHRLVGAIIPRANQWFFYKLLGDADAVAAEREAFIRFASSPP